MTNSVKFTKMQGLGNDFIIMDAAEAQKSSSGYSSLAEKICDRKFGVGADGLIIVNPEDMWANTDICWRILNSDGSEPQMCGNGIRCFAKYVHDRGLVKNKKFTINTLAGIIIPEILDNQEVKVDMGVPVFSPERIPLAAESNIIEVKGRKFEFNAVSMGNPHCVIFTHEDTAALALEYGAEIEKHQYFPEKTNVEFVKIISRDRIRIDVWERGCGITLACGTGACASGVAAIKNSLVNNRLTAELPGGELQIEWKNSSEDNSVFMTGKSEYVFYGEYLL